MKARWWSRWVDEQHLTWYIIDRSTVSPLVSVQASTYTHKPMTDQDNVSQWRDINFIIVYSGWVVGARWWSSWVEKQHDTWSINSFTTDFSTSLSLHTNLTSEDRWRQCKTMVWYKFKTFYSGCFIVCLYLFIFWGYFIVPCGKFGSPFIWIKYNSRRKCCRFLSVSIVFSCVHIIVWLPVFVIFNARTYADVCDCARGL